MLFRESRATQHTENGPDAFCQQESNWSVPCVQTWKLERFGKPNFSSIRRQTDDDRIRDRNVNRKMLPNRSKISVDLAPKRIEILIWFDLMPIAKLDFWTEVRRSCVTCSAVFSRNQVKLTPCVRPPRIMRSLTRTK